MSFADIVGHQKQLATLRAAWAGGRLHHAYLFLGPEGVGKHTIAIALAKAIHCASERRRFLRPVRQLRANCGWQSSRCARR